MACLDLVGLSLQALGRHVCDQGLEHPGLCHLGAAVDFHMAHHMENILKKVMRKRTKREKKNLLLIPVVLQQHILGQHQQHQVNLVNLSLERNKTVEHFHLEVVSSDQGVNFRVSVLTFIDIQLPDFPP